MPGCCPASPANVDTAMASPINDRTAKFNAGVLAAAQAIGGATGSMVIGTGGLVGLLMAPTPALATVPVTAFVVGSALASAPAALLMGNHGRRVGFSVGALLGLAGGVTAAYGIWLSLFSLFCLGTLLIGCFLAFTQQYRLAAADGTSDDFRPIAISLVMAGGVLAGIIGPQTVIATRDLYPGLPYIATFLALGGFALLSLLLVNLLRAPPPAPAGSDDGPVISYGQVVRTPGFIVAAICGMLSYALMSFVMTAAPIAMVACGHSPDTALLGIQWHVTAMFAPSFFTGNLIKRFGVRAVTATGFVFLGSSAAISLSGLEVWQFWSGLILLGVGWNFGFIGATTMIANAFAGVSQRSRGRAQALNEVLVFSTVALGSFSSGIMLDVAGWAMINVLVLPTVAAAIALLIWSAARRPAPVLAASGT